MKSPALVLFIGNRDLQFPEQTLTKLPSDFASLLEPNNDAPSYFVISKKNPSNSFLNISQSAFQKYETLSSYFQFPLLYKTLDFITTEIKQVSNLCIYIFATRQAPTPDPQDTYFIGKILHRYLDQKGFDAELIEIQMDPTSIQELFIFLYSYYDQIQQNHHPVYIEDAGGTPQLRTASHLAGLFRKFIFLTLNARNDIQITENFMDFEKIILKNILMNMLSTYDFAGILKLPLDIDIHNEARIALNKLNLIDINITGENYLTHSLNALNLLMENLRLNYIQERYTDCIGRIFRLEEATWHIFLFDYLSEKKLIDNHAIGNSFKSENFSSLFSRNMIPKTSKLFLHHFPNIFEEKNNQIFFKKMNNKSISEYGKNFTYFFFKELGEYPDLIKFFESINTRGNNPPYNSSPLNELRNQSIMGHGFKGVSKKQLNKILKKNLHLWLDELKEIIKKYIPSFNYDNVFEKHKNEIIRLYEYQKSTTKR